MNKALIIFQDEMKVDSIKNESFRSARQSQ